MCSTNAKDRQRRNRFHPSSVVVSTDSLGRQLWVQTFSRYCSSCATASRSLSASAGSYKPFPERPNIRIQPMSSKPSQFMDMTFVTRRAAVAHAEKRVPKGTDNSGRGCSAIVALLSAISIRVYEEHSAKLERSQTQWRKEGPWSGIASLETHMPARRAPNAPQHETSLAFPLSRVPVSQANIKNSPRTFHAFTHTR